jgi:hypothetical protein
MVGNPEVIGWRTFYICDFGPRRLKIGKLLPVNPKLISGFVDMTEFERGKVLPGSANILLFWHLYSLLPCS